MSKSLNQNVHILLHKKELRLLKRYALTKKKSMGELVREAIRKVYGTAEPAKKQDAFLRLSQRNELKMEDWSKVKKDLLHRYD